MTPIIEFHHVCKRYGAREALTDVSFRANRGEIIALMGRNGAGKSTLMNVMTGYLHATSGSVLLAGHDICADERQAKACFGYLPEQPPLYPDLTVTEYLCHCARLKGLKGRALRSEINRVIDKTGLSAHTNRLSGRLSKGYRQRLGLAQALLGAPPLLIMDEPANGLDPMQMSEMRALIKELVRDSTVLLSSHILSEVTNVCTRALVLEAGRLLFDGDMRALTEESHVLTLKWQGGEGVCDRLFAIENALQVTISDNSAEITEKNGCDLRPAAFHAVADSGAELLEMTHKQTSLESAFLRLIGEEKERV